jgi:hypothetical protein
MIHDEQPKPWRSFKVGVRGQEQSLFDYEAHLRAQYQRKSGLVAHKLLSASDAAQARAQAQAADAQVSFNMSLKRTSSITRTQSNERAQRENELRNRYRHSASPIVAACLQGSVKALRKLLAATPPKLLAATPPKLLAATPPKLLAATPPGACTKHTHMFLLRSLPL